MMKLLNSRACLFAIEGGNGVSKITDCNGRCRNGWVFGQGFDSPQVHSKWKVRKQRKYRIYAGFRCFLRFVKNSDLDHFNSFGSKKSGVKSGVQKLVKIH